MNLCIQNNYLNACFHNKGAELISLKYQNNELIWNAQEPWKRHAPLLFPIVGKLKNDEYLYQNKKYSMQQHGFARDMDWLCTFQSDECIEFELTDNDDTFLIYPFHFSLIVKYELIETSLIITFQVFNPSHHPLLFSIGYHPAFYLPFQLNNYALKIYPYQHELYASILNQGLITSDKKVISLKNSVLPLCTQLFDNDALVLENFNIDNIELFTSQQNFSINVHTGNAKNIGIWTKPNCEDFICIEPWMGIADNTEHHQHLEQKKDIVFLPAYQAWKWTVSIEIKDKNIKV